MKIVAPHLNLLRPDERLSSSPVRLRVMGPVLATLACAGLLVWWGVLGMQTMMAKSAVSSLKSELGAKQAAHGAILELMAEVREKGLVLDQLKFYSAGRRVYGPFLARLAEVFPEDVQLLALTVPEAKEQDLSNPLKPKGPKLLGPNDPAEATSLRLMGRTPKAAPVNALMSRLRKDEFTNLLVRVAEPDAYPKIHAFRQETAGGKSDRLLEFDIEFACAERRFAK